MTLKFQKTILRLTIHFNSINCNTVAVRLSGIGYTKFDYRNRVKNRFRRIIRIDFDLPPHNPKLHVFLSYSFLEIIKICFVLISESYVEALLKINNKLEKRK
jgi:hypothetical protein